MHDVGKLKIPDEILNKPAKLTDREFEEMKKHTNYGFTLILNSKDFTETEALVAIEHHERADGKGYPFFKRESETNFYSRIVHVADVFHAMSSRRCYKNEMPFYDVLFTMNKEIFGNFDPIIALKFLNHVMESLINEKVLLSSGEEAMIRFINPLDPTRPLVEAESGIIDLSRNLNINIIKLI